MYPDNPSLEYYCLQHFYINRLVFSVLSQNKGESVTVVTLMGILDAPVLTHSISGYSWCYCWAIVEPQRYSSKLFGHSGLEHYIWVHSPILLVDMKRIVSLFAFTSSTYSMSYLLCLMLVRFACSFENLI